MMKNIHILACLSFLCLSCVSCSEKKDISEMIKAAESGNPKAQAELGLIYETGDTNVPQNISNAIEWYQKAVDGGDADAALHLGLMYFTGTGVHKNHASAVNLYEKAAERGNNDAQFILSNLYFNGVVVPKDMVKAYAWVSLALDGEGETGADAKRRIEAITSIMIPQQLLQAQAEATRLLINAKKK